MTDRFSEQFNPAILERLCLNIYSYGSSKEENI
jgi:hypothetical protein